MASRRPTERARHVLEPRTEPRVARADVARHHHVAAFEIGIRLDRHATVVREQRVELGVIVRVTTHDELPRAREPLERAARLFADHARIDGALRGDDALDDTERERDELGLRQRAQTRAFLGRGEEERGRALRRVVERGAGAPLALGARGVEDASALGFRLRHDVGGCARRRDVGVGRHAARVGTTEYAGHGLDVARTGMQRPGVTCILGDVRIAVVAASLLVLALLSARTPAYAQAEDCAPGEIGPLEVTPADGAAQVTLDAYVAVRYSPGYFEPTNGSPVETVVLMEEESGDLVPGAQQRVGDVLFFVPAAALAPSTSYFGVATGPAGDFEFGFRTGTIADQLPPSITEGIDDRRLEIRTGRVDPSCESEEGGVRVGVTVTRATDDGPAGSVEYYLYLTRAPNLEAPELVARVRNFTSAETMTLAFVLPASKTGVAACVSLVVSDGVGRTSRWAEPVCFDPTVESRFLGLCTQSVAGAGRARRGQPLVAVLCLTGAVLAARRRRRRGPPRNR